MYRWRRGRGGSPMRNRSRSVWEDECPCYSLLTAMRLPQRRRDIPPIHRRHIRRRLERQRLRHERLRDILWRHLTAEQVAAHIVLLADAARFRALLDEIVGEQA